MPETITAKEVVDWLRSQSPDREFYYGDNFHCAVASYVKESLGGERVQAGGSNVDFIPAGEEESVCAELEHALARGLAYCAHTFTAAQAIESIEKELGV